MFPSELLGQIWNYMFVSTVLTQINYIISIITSGKQYDFRQPVSISREPDANQYQLIETLLKITGK